MSVGAALTRPNYTETADRSPRAYAGRVVDARRSVLVVGAGIIGLASSFRLARRGHDVTLLDPSPGAGATRAAAGMIAASAEATSGERDNFELQREALAAWRRLNDELAGVGAAPVALQRPGSLVVGWSAGDRGAVRRFGEVAAQVGAPARAVDRRTDPELFADLSERVAEGLYLPEDAWLDPDDAVASLRDGLARAGANLVEDRVVEVGRDASGVVARGERGEYAADLGVIATGAGDVPRGARPSGRFAVRPVRGSTVRLRGLEREDRVMVRAFVRGRPLYLVGRAGRGALLGATSEERSDPGVDVGELARLLRDALDVLPALEGATVVETRSGLRPASSDGRPFLEAVEPAGWAWTSGHYRHGITLAPDAAERVVAHVEAP